MDVSVRHVESGRGCVVGVADGGTVLSLKADAVKEMFAGSINADREAAGLAARIEGCGEDLDDAERVANTGLEVGDPVQLVRRWPHVKAPAVYNHEWDYAESVTLSRCGMLCSVASGEGHITVLDTRTAGVVADLTHGEEGVCGTEFSVCGRWLATCSDDKSICVWLTATWEQVCRLEEHDTEACSAGWTHCGRLVSGDAHGKVSVWDLEGTPSATVLDGHNSAVSGIAVSTTRIFTGSLDSSIRVYDISTLTHTDTLSEHMDAVHHIALTDDGRHLVSSSGDKSLKVWCTTTLTCIRSVVVSDPPCVLSVSQPGDVVAVSFYGQTKLYSLSTLQCLGRVKSEGLAVALSPCGRWVFTAAYPSVRVSAVCDVPREGST